MSFPPVKNDTNKYVVVKAVIKILFRLFLHRILGPLTIIFIGLAVLILCWKVSPINLNTFFQKKANSNVTYGTAAPIVTGNGNNTAVQHNSVED